MKTLSRHTNLPCGLETSLYTIVTTLYNLQLSTFISSVTPFHGTTHILDPNRTNFKFLSWNLIITHGYGRGAGQNMGVNSIENYGEWQISKCSLSDDRRKTTGAELTPLQKPYTALHSRQYKWRPYSEWNIYTKQIAIVLPFNNIVARHIDDVQTI
jgi:hypothetical protein